MRKRGRVDQSHQPIVDAFRKCGWNVLSLAPLGNGCPDLLVEHPARVAIDHDWQTVRLFYLIEVKTGKGKLREKQYDFAKTWPVHVLRSQDEAIQFMKDRTER